MIKIPPLAFALGTYLPMEINTPVLVGGILSYLVSHSSDDDETNERRLSEGGTVASGLSLAALSAVSLVLSCTSPELTGS